MGEGAGRLGHAAAREVGPGQAVATAQAAAPALATAIALAAAFALATALACAHAPAPGAGAADPSSSAAPPPSAAPSDPLPGATGFRFVEVGAEAGLTSPYHAGRPGKDHLLDSAGSGVAFLDYDRDGWLDIYLPNGWKIEGDRLVERGRAALYRGRPGGRFEDVTDAAGVGGEGVWGGGAAAADYDGDGFTDILLTGYGPIVLYRNRGDGRFENVAPRVGLDAPGWNTAASWFDADSDGDLDLYVAAYIDCTLEEILTARPTLDWKGVEKVAFGPFGMTGAPDHFFVQEGGRFVDATEAAGFADLALGFGFATRTGDFDGDGDVDLYVANDSDPNYLYRNEGGGRFREVGVMSGAALDAGGSAQASMGIAAGDLEWAGRLDLAVTNFAEDFSTLYRNLGGGFFEDVSETTGVGPATWKSLSWGIAFADFDADGDLDLVIANGHIYPQVDRHPEIVGTFAQRPTLLENRGGMFVDAGASAGPGFAEPLAARGLAVGDYDNDGDPDILLGRLDAPPALLRNDSSPGAWLMVAPEGPRGGPAPPGTRVTVRAGGRMHLRDVASGDSYASTHDARLHFGLGAATVADEVTVRWPDGATRTLRAVALRQVLVVRRAP